MKRVKATLQRRWLTSSLIILAAAVALGEPAAAQPLPETERVILERQLVELRQKARDLNEQIRRIEAQLGRDASSAAVVSPRGATAKQSGTGDCALPFYLDSTGLKRVRPECLATSSDALCDMPFLLDENGRRRVRPACSATPPGLPRDE